MEKVRKKKVVIFLGIGVVGLLILLSIKVHNAAIQVDNAFTNDLPDTYSIPVEDSGLISSKYWDKLKVDRIVRSKVRQPVSLLFFDKDYHLIIYRIDLKKDTLLSDILHTSFKSVDRTTKVVYTVLDIDNYFRFQYRASIANPASHIYLTLDGNSFQNVMKNDSIVSCHLLCKNFSIRYDEISPIDIFVVGEEKMLGMTTAIPMNLLFLKRNAAIYLLMMAPNNPKSSIPPDLLYNVVMGI